MPNRMKRLICPVFLILLLVTSCSPQTAVYPETVLEGQSVTELAPLPFSPEYTDELVPDGYLPLRDDLILWFSIGEDSMPCLVDPYSTRTSLLCGDPLCPHGEESFDCPLFGFYFTPFSPAAYRDGSLYFCGGDTGLIDFYDGSVNKIVKKLGMNGYGIVRYHPDTLERTVLLHADDRAAGKYPIENLCIDGNALYYYDRVEPEDDRVTEKLYRMDLEDGSVADLGEYLGYTHIIVYGGYIWNYFGDLNPNNSPLWEPNADYLIRCDLNNENPERVPFRHEMSASPEDYVLPRTDTRMGLTFLLYVGDEDEPHAYRSENIIVSYENGAAIEYTLNEEDREMLFYHDLYTGEKRQLLADWDPGDDERIPRFACVYAGRYAIFAMYDMPEGRNTLGRMRYYVRADLFTGETARILPPE